MRTAPARSGGPQYGSALEDAVHVQVALEDVEDGWGPR